jgi:hypothetical protein
VGGWFLLILFLQSACATGVPQGGMLVGLRHNPLTPPPALRQSVTLTPGSDFAPVQVSDVEFREAFTQLVLQVPLRVAPRPTRPLAGRLVLASWPSGGAGISVTEQLWDDAEEASTFRELRESSERYAQVLGPNTLRILLLLATWRAGAKASQGGGLPGLPQAVHNAATVGGFRLPTAAAEATSVSVVEGRLALTLPAGSGAILFMQEKEAGDIHHIATVENKKSPASGGPWTPELKKFFDKAGMSMEEPANKVRIPGHKGPHPKAYHQEVFRRLEKAVKTCETTAQCREALTRELERLATELKEAGSKLNKLVTRTE